MTPSKKSVIILAIGYTIFMSCFGVWQHGFPLGIYMGVGSGILFGLLMYWFTKSKWFARKQNNKVDPS